MKNYRKLLLCMSIFLCAALQTNYATPFQPQVPELPKGDYQELCKPECCRYDAGAKRLTCLCEHCKPGVCTVVEGKCICGEGVRPFVQAELKPVELTDTVTFNSKTGRLAIVA